MQATTNKTATRPWNYHSAVSDCQACEGHGGVWNGRGLGGNDPDSWSVPCEDCEETGIEPCSVCGFNVHVAGTDCLACQTVFEIADKDLTPEVRAALLDAVGTSFDVAAKAAAQSERLAA